MRIYPKVWVIEECDLESEYSHSLDYFFLTKEAAFEFICGKVIGVHEWREKFNQGELRFSFSGGGYRLKELKNGEISV